MEEEIESIPPTKEEKIASLTGTFVWSRNKILMEYLNAQVSGDTATMTALAEDLKELNSQYDLSVKEVELE